MTPDDRLTEVFDRGLAAGVDSLSPSDRELFAIQDFILSYEMGDLSGYFYNRLPDLHRIRTAVAAMRRRGLTELARLLNEALELFTGYCDPNPPSTWGTLIRQYDPANKLERLSRQIAALDDYGLKTSSIQ